MEQLSLEMKKINRATIYIRVVKLILRRLLKGKWQVQGVTEITGDDLLDRINSDQVPLIIDVRTTQEYKGGFGHIPNSKSLPLMQFESDFENLSVFREKILELTSNFEDFQANKEKEIITICPGGGMSLVAAEIMAEANFEDVKSLKGGIDAWFKKGYPTTGT